MKEIGAFEAKNTLGTLLDHVERGEEIVITRHGKPVARLVPNSAARRPESGGSDVRTHPGTGAASAQVEKPAGRLQLARTQENARRRSAAMSLVLDCSVTLAWVYSDETTPPVRHVFDLLSQSGAWVPGLWRLEVANVLEMSARRGRHADDLRDATLADLAQLPIQVDTETDRQAWGPTVHLADRHKLTLYDAAYLELALRRNLPLATLDADLRRAAKAAKSRVAGRVSGRKWEVGRKQVKPGAPFLARFVREKWGIG